MRPFRSLRLALALGLLPVGCVDEDVNSASGSFVTITTPAPTDGGADEVITIDDVDGRDGVLLDCASLFDASVGVTDGEVSVGAKFPADTPLGAELDVPDEATVSIEVGGERATASSGTLVVDANGGGLDVRVAVTLDVIAGGRRVEGTLDCLETNADIAAASCVRSGGGGGDSDFDSD